MQKKQKKITFIDYQAKLISLKRVFAFTGQILKIYALTFVFFTSQSPKKVNKKVLFPAKN